MRRPTLAERLAAGTLAWLAAAALALNLLRHGRKPGAPAGPGGSLSWGLVVAGAAALVLAWVVASLWSTNPDFIYHWGIKGHRFFLAGGIDEAFLKKPWNRLSHPDYPFLQPELFAVTAVLRGFFDEPAMLLESALWCFLAAVAARQALLVGGASRFAAESGAAAVGLTLAMFSVAHRLAGGPDPILALVLTAAAAPFFAPVPAQDERRRIGAWDAQLAVAAAVAAAAKMEGAPLAAFMLTAYGLRQGLWRRPWPLPRLAFLGGPLLIAVAPWWIQVQWLELAGRANAGPFEWGHWAAIAPELLSSLLHSHWHGLALMLFLTLPLVLLERRARPLVLVCLAQLLLYVYVYFTALEAPEVHVRSSFTRVLCHVVPAWLTAALLAFDVWVERRASKQAQKAPTSARPQTLP